MKKISFLLILIAAGCYKEQITSSQGSATFSMSIGARNGGRLSQTSIPMFALISIEDSNGKTVLENKKLNLYSFGQGYESEGLQLTEGNYWLTQFQILNAHDTVIYASPMAGSALAQYVTNPLPINFTITKNATTEVVPQVLEVSSNDTPEKFGYVSFGFEVVSMKIKLETSVTMLVGDVHYQNCDAQIRVKGFNSFGNQEYTEDFSFHGPEDILEFSGAHKYYSFDLIIWGQTYPQYETKLPVSELWNDRADGPSPVTYNFGGVKKPKKLKMQTRYKEVYDNVSGSTKMIPEERISYSYSLDGRLEYIYHETYNKQNFQFEEANIEEFIYGIPSSTVLKIKVTMNGNLYEDYSYEYGLSSLTEKYRITRANFLDGTSIAETFTRNDDSSDPNSVTVDYNFSNGSSVAYKFDFYYKTMVSDQTTQNGQLCNQGNYTYDKNINPFKHLGYLDFDLNYWSANNRLTENVIYSGCGYPTLTPVSHSYTYDSDGYPTSKITSYKLANGQNAPGHTKTEFVYY